MFMPMPPGSDKLSEKNRNEICQLLCMPHGNNKLWQIIKQMTYKKPQYSQKTSLSV